MSALGGRSFRYLRDPLFLVCGCGYCVNRWLLKPNIHSAFLRNWCNDLLLAPCALPVVFWIFRRLGLRAVDEPPGLLELFWILALWSVLFEWIGPRFVRHAVGDWRDVLMYFLGGAAAWLFWHWAASREPRSSYHEL